MFTQFDAWDTKVGAIELHGRSAGSGPAVVLLHGHPRTHTTWYRVAPLLVEAGFTVICPDLRGYGHSSKPAPDAGHEIYSDRTMAGDIAELMTGLGHEQFAIVGHDRGSYVAYRTALDYPGRIRALVVLDSVPIVEALERVDAHFAETWWHWFFYATPAAERLITADPIGWYQPDPHAMGRENYGDLVDALADPDTVRGMLSDYAASLHTDRRVDEYDRDSNRLIQCPTLVGWSARDDMADLYGDPARIWEPWCTYPPHSVVIDSGHHMAEENPDAVAAALTDFLRQCRH